MTHIFFSVSLKDLFESSVSWKNPEFFYRNSSLVIY